MQIYLMLNTKWVENYEVQKMEKSQWYYLKKKKDFLMPVGVTVYT